MTQNARAAEAAAQARQAAEQAQGAAEHAREMAAQRVAEQVAAAIAGRQGPVGAQQRLRQELRDQLSELMHQREEVSDQLSNPMVSGSNRAGLSSRIEHIDARINALDRQIEELDVTIARSGGAVAGARVPSGPRQQSSDPPEAYIALGGLFMLCAVLPLSIAYARRIWRRSATAVGALPKEIGDRLAHMDQNLDAIALEVERIGEAQRYLTRMQGQGAVGAGQAQPIEAPEREKDWQRRGS
jgi:hypothetical protein